MIEAHGLMAEPPVPHELDREGLYLMADPHQQVVDLEQYAPRPYRPRGCTVVHDVRSLVAYVARHRIDEGPTTAEGVGVPELWADIDSVTIAAVLNPHDDVAEMAGWHDWTAQLTLRRTPEWKAWLEGDRSMTDQVHFAEHVEDHLDDIVAPPAADLLELARTFETKTDVAFRSAIVLESGDRQLTYQEATQAQAGKSGDITVPDRFTLGIAPFEGCDPYRVEARLRYRVREGRLAIGYQLVRPDLVERSAFNDAVAEVEGAAQLVAHRGRATVGVGG